MTNNIQDRRISRAELTELLSSMGSDISTHSLSMWIKSKTNDEFVVVPRSFCYVSVMSLDMALERDLEEGSEKYLETKNYLKQIEIYL